MSRKCKNSIRKNKNFGFLIKLEKLNKDSKIHVDSEARLQIQQCFIVLKLHLVFIPPTPNYTFKKIQTQLLSTYPSPHQSNTLTSAENLALLFSLSLSSLPQAAQTSISFFISLQTTFIHLCSFIRMFVFCSLPFQHHVNNSHFRSANPNCILACFH